MVMKKRIKVVRGSSGDRINKQIKAVFIVVLVIVAVAALYLAFTSEEVLLSPQSGGLGFSNADSIAGAIGVGTASDATIWFCSGGKKPFNTMTGEPVGEGSFTDLRGALGPTNTKKLTKKYCGKTVKKLISAPKPSPSPTGSP